MNKVENHLQFRKLLWESADNLRGNVSSEKYMYIVIGLLFLKYASDKYDKAILKLKEKYPKEWKEYSKNNDILSTEFDTPFIVPKEASWEHVSGFASQKEIGIKIDEAFLSLEKVNKNLSNLFEKDYNSVDLDPIKLGKVVTIFSDIDLEKHGEDFIGRTYEYFLGHFFKKQGQKGGEFYTPLSVVKLLVEIIQPKKGKVYDPACGTGGMFIQVKQKIEENKKNIHELSIYGQESQNKIWKLARINLMLHGFDSDNIRLGAIPADTFAEDQHQGEYFDYIFANPPFNIKKWNQEKLIDDLRWRKWGLPPKGNANYAWLSHILYKLEKEGKAGIVLANGSLSSQNKQELEIRKKLISKNKIDAIITLPEKLFYTTQIPACLWILNNQKNKKNKKVLMVYANELKGNMINKKLRELKNTEIERISHLYNKHKKGEIINEIEFAKSVDPKEIIENDCFLMPGFYVEISNVKEKIDPKKLKEELKNLKEKIPEMIQELNETSDKVKTSIEKLIEEIKDD